MSAEQDRKRAERLAEDEWPYEHIGMTRRPARTDCTCEECGVNEGRRLAYVAGYLASKQLTEAEWSEKREQVARAIFSAMAGTFAATVDLSYDGPDLDYTRECCRRDAESAMNALGFTRKDDE